MSTPQVHVEDMLKTDVGNLYSDMRDEGNLDPNAQKIFSQYLTDLQELSTLCRLDDEESDISAWANWENGLRNFYKRLVYDAFDAKGVTVPRGMEIHFAGSLARKQATEYSDLDAFVLFANSTDREDAQAIFEGLNNLFQRIFWVNNQLYPDPIGINPARLNGTVDDIIGKLKSKELDTDTTVRSIMSSAPITQNYKLGEKLRQRIKDDPELGAIWTPRAIYKQAIESFKAPKENAQQVSIKSHIMRPIDFILMGLREEFDLYNEDGTHLSAPGTLRMIKANKELYRRPDIKEMVRLVEITYNEAMRLRFSQHREARQENDDIPQEQVQHLLANVQRLRELAQGRVEQLNGKASMPEPVMPEQVIVAAKPTFWQNHGFKIMLGVGILLLSLIAAGIGVALVLTGVLAPLGAGLLGIAAWGAIMGGSALVGGLVGASIGAGIASLIPDDRGPESDEGYQPVSQNPDSPDDSPIIASEDSEHAFARPGRFFRPEPIDIPQAGKRTGREYDTDSQSPSFS